MTNTTSDSDAKQHACEGSNMRSDTSRVAHDIRASLLIVNGFNQVLESNLAELCEAYQEIFDAHPDVLQTAKAANVKELETDCWKCLSQVQRSVERLNHRISDQDSLNASVDCDGSRDVS